MKKQSSEQHTQIDNTEQAIDILNKWFEEDKENRGFIILTSERGEKVDDENTCSGHFSLLGMEDILTEGLVKCMCHSDNPLIKVLKNAIDYIILLKHQNNFNF